MTNVEWHQYSRLILSELKDLKEGLGDHQEKDLVAYTAIHEQITLLRIDVMGLKKESAYVGAAAGFIASLIPVVIGFAFEYFVKK